VRVGTLNARGLTLENGCHASRLLAVMALLEEQGVEVAAICETWFKQGTRAVEEAVRWCEEKGWSWIDHQRMQRDSK
jgi:hypothetical protein